MGSFRNHSRNFTLDGKTVGVDDGAFPPNKRTKHYTVLVAAVFQSLQMTDLRVGRIEVDGRDANRVLASLLRHQRFDVVLVSGISFGGFNVADIDGLSHEFGKPVIVVTGDKPDNAAVLKALRDHFADWRERWRMIQSAGRTYSCRPLADEPELYFEVRGCSAKYAQQVIESTAVISRLPEPVRVARIIAKALSELVRSAPPRS